MAFVHVMASVMYSTIPIRSRLHCPCSGATILCTLPADAPALRITYMTLQAPCSFKYAVYRRKVADEDIEIHVQRLFCDLSCYHQATMPIFRCAVTSKRLQYVSFFIQSVL